MTDQDINRFTPPKAHLVEPDSLADGPVLAGRGLRLVAVILDSLLISLVILPLYLVFGGMSIMTDLDPNAPPDAFAMMGKMLGAMIPGYVVAAAVQGWSLHAFGGTLGKKLLGLRIVRTDGSRAGFVRLFFGRGAVALVPGFIPLIGSLWALVDSVLIFRDSRQCLHDQIADTKVVTAASSMNASLAAARA
ncbi:MAG: RDD family protein [Betaproteobacteria bacterium]